MNYLVGTNIKMYLTYLEALEWLRGMNRDVPSVGLVDVALFPPFFALVEGPRLIAKPNIGLGAQNMAWEERGPYTGEVSALMLKELGLTYAELGHHERRLHFGETDRLVRRKIELALASGLRALVCVGEEADVHRRGGAEDFLAGQMDELVSDLRLDDPARLIVAYEPRWAIGAAEAAPPEHAARGCAVVRDRLVARLGPKGREVRIIYGGAVKLSDAAEMLAQENVCGLFIGRAALDTSDFAQAVAAAQAQAEKDLAAAGRA
ncbi:MAG: triose-phosphate isomerase [Deltaproteobacteria bacterium]|jgi:triosephosphate isomerase|nr:triose-phosphate isomerase [Deltaproteobacteria bacterium]